MRPSAGHSRKTDVCQTLQTLVAVDVVPARVLRPRILPWPRTDRLSNYREATSIFFDTVDGEQFPKGGVVSVGWNATDSLALVGEFALEHQDLLWGEAARIEGLLDDGRRPDWQPVLRSGAHRTARNPDDRRTSAGHFDHDTNRNRVSGRGRVWVRPDRSRLHQGYRRLPAAILQCGRLCAADQRDGKRRRRNGESVIFVSGSNCRGVFNRLTSACGRLKTPFKAGTSKHKETTAAFSATDALFPDLVGRSVGRSHGRALRLGRAAQDAAGLVRDCGDHCLSDVAPSRVGDSTPLALACFCRSWRSGRGKPGQSGRSYAHAAKRPGGRCRALLISAIVEPIEFLLVGLLNRGLTTDPDLYFQVRNQPAVLASKLVYNTAAAIVGGWVAAWVARRAPVAHGIALAVIQTAAFGWALANPRFAIDTGLDVGLFDRFDIRRDRRWLAAAIAADRAEWPSGKVTSAEWPGTSASCRCQMLLVLRRGAM